MRPFSHHDTTIEGVEAVLSDLWRRAPGLRPVPEMNDYPLTYPPAVQLQTADYETLPQPEEFTRYAVGDLKGAGLYFHFGFCVYRCRYCFHYELTTRGKERMGRYVSALIQEMSMFRRMAPSIKVGLYFLGGGTPTSLPVPLLGRFLDALQDGFGPPPTRMSTVEAKPITASDEKLAMLVNAGFERINLGVQTLDPALYAFHHQKEDLQVALDAIDRARQAGFSFINIDLMTGLEGQSPESWNLTLKTVERLARAGEIDSLFLYPYHDDPRSRTYHDARRVPSFAETAWTDATLRSLMERLGWRELGARFYRSPRHVRHEVVELARTRINPAYGEVLYHGFGNSSFSLGDRATYLNHRNLETYMDAIEANKTGLGHWTLLTQAQRAARDVSFDLLYSPYTRIRTRSRKYGATAMVHQRSTLDRWVEMGLGRKHKLAGTFSLTPLGKLVHQQMIPHHYLPHDAMRQRQVMETRREAGKRYRGY